MSVSQDLVVSEARYLLQNSEVVQLRRCNEGYASLAVYTCNEYTTHRWYSGGWCVAPRSNFYPYYDDDDWVAVPDLYVVGKACVFNRLPSKLDRIMNILV